MHPRRFSAAGFARRGGPPRIPSLSTRWQPWGLGPRQAMLPSRRPASGTPLRGRRGVSTVGPSRPPPRWSPRLRPKGTPSSG
eukprot:15430877-Alexandrium_andersonii.AAC.1